MSLPSITYRAHANQLIYSCIESHREIWEANTAAESYMINMEAPLPQEELTEKAKWAANFNYGRGLNIIKRLVKENTTEITRSISLMDIEMRKFDKTKDTQKIYGFLAIPELKKEIAERIAYVYADFIDKEQIFNTFVSRAEYMNFLFGYAAAVRGDEGYLPDIVHFKDIGFEDHTNINDIQRFVVFETMKGDFFFTKLMELKDYFTTKEITEAMEGGFFTLNPEEETVVDKDGWNPEGVLEIVCACFSSNPEAVKFLKEHTNWQQTEENPHCHFSTWDNIYALTQKMGNDWCLSNINNIYTARCYEIGEDGLHEARIYINNATQDIERSNYSQVRNIFYYKCHADCSQSEAISMVYDFGIDGSNFIHEIKGACYPLCQHAIRFDVEQNNLKDSAFISNTIWIQTVGTGQINRSAEMSIAGGIGMVSQNIEFVQMKQRVDLSDNMLAIQQEKQEFNENFTRHQPQTSLSNRPTKDEVSFVNAEAYSQRNADIPFKLKAYSKIIFNAFRKLIGDDYISSNFEKDRERFINKFISEFEDLDLTKEQILKILKCVESIDITPVLSDREAISQALSFAATGAARRRLTKMYLLSYGFRINQIRSYIDSEDYGTDASIVSFENDLFERTSEVTFGLNQDHILHLNGHFYKMDRRMQGVTAGEDPVIALNVLRNGLINCRLHINALATLPFYKKQIKEYEQYYKMFEKELQALAQDLDQQRQKAQQNGQQGGQMQISPELQQKLRESEIKLKDKLRTSAMRTQQAQEQKIQNQQFNQQLKAEDAQFKRSLEQMKAETLVNATLMQKSAEMAR